MFLHVHPDDEQSYYVNVDHVVRLQWHADDWEARLDVRLEGGEQRHETWDWETRSYDEETEEWSTDVDQETRRCWLETERQLELFARHQEMEWARVEATVEEVIDS